MFNHRNSVLCGSVESTETAMVQKYFSDHAPRVAIKVSVNLDDGMQWTGTGFFVPFDQASRFARRCSGRQARKHGGIRWMSRVESWGLGSPGSSAGRRRRKGGSVQGGRPPEYNEEPGSGQMSGPRRRVQDRIGCCVELSGTAASLNASEETKG